MEPLATTLCVRVLPRASRSEILGWAGEVLRLRVTAPPVKGGANEAVVRLLAGTLGIPRTRICILSGETARTKTVRVEGLTPEEVRRRLGGQLRDR